MWRKEPRPELCGGAPCRAVPGRRRSSSARTGPAFWWSSGNTPGDRISPPRTSRCPGSTTRRRSPRLSSGPSCGKALAVCGALIQFSVYSVRIYEARPRQRGRMKRAAVYVIARRRALWEVSGARYSGRAFIMTRETFMAGFLLLRICINITLMNIFIDN